MAHIYEIYRDRAGQYRARFKYNSEVLFSTEGYSSKASALNAIESMKRYAPEAPVESVDDARGLAESIRLASVPAADRVVSPNHNSKEFKDFQSAYQKLNKKIRTGNDLGDFGPDEIEVAKNEIEQIGSSMDQALLRPAQVWQYAVNSMLWIADKAAGALVGSLAIALLVALAAVLGIQIS